MTARIATNVVTNQNIEYLVKISWPALRVPKPLSTPASWIGAARSLTHGQRQPLLEHPLHGAARELGGVHQAQLLLDVLAIGFDRFGAQPQPGGDLLGRQPLADHLEALELAIREGFDGRAARLGLVGPR